MAVDGIDAPAWKDKLQHGWQMFLGFVFLGATIAAAIYFFEAGPPKAFWIAATVALIALAFSKDRLEVAAVTATYAGGPIAVAAAHEGRWGLLAGLVGAFGALYATRSLRARRARAKSFRLAESRFCPSCGRPTSVEQVIEGVHEGSDARYAINQCPCGEWTLFDDSGAACHIDPPRPQEPVKAEGWGVPHLLLAGVAAIMLTIALAVPDRWTDFAAAAALAVAALVAAYVFARRRRARMSEL
jgi:hypothetical protein